MNRRGAKQLYFQMTTVSTGAIDKASQVGAVSLSGAFALTVISDKEEMKKSSAGFKDLFKIKWKKEVVLRPKE